MLSTPQLIVIKADILSDPILAAHPNTADGAFSIATAYNLPVAPEFWVWRTSVPKSELVQGVSADGTTFDWTGTGFIARVVGERDAWRELFGEAGICNPSLANVRQAFLDIFSGAIAPAPANRTHLATVARRPARRIEKLFATGTGSAGLPAVMAFEGAVSYIDIMNARAS